MSDFYVQREAGQLSAGFASLGALLLMLAVLFLGLSCLLFAQNTRRMAAEYQREVQLANASASALCRVAKCAEEEKSFLQEHELARLYAEEKKLPAGRAAVEVSGVRRGKLVFLVSVAYEKDPAWQRRQVSRGVLREEENGYVWLGRTP